MTTDHWSPRPEVQLLSQSSKDKHIDMLGTFTKMVLCLWLSLLSLASVSRGEHEEEIVFVGWLLYMLHCFPGMAILPKCHVTSP